MALRFGVLPRSLSNLSLFRHSIRRAASSLTHIDSDGNASMVNISSKPTTSRTATAVANISLGNKIYKLLKESMTVSSTPSTKKGDVFTVAQLAGIMAAKKTPDLIPLCHTVPLSQVLVELSLDNMHEGVTILATASTTAQTGVEMEALTAASVAALTVYDMCKAGGKGMQIHEIKLLKKTGGVSGNYHAPKETIKAATSP